MGGQIRLRKTGCVLAGNRIKPADDTKMIDVVIGFFATQGDFDEIWAAPQDG